MLHRWNPAPIFHAMGKSPFAAYRSGQIPCISHYRSGTNEPWTRLVLTYKDFSAATVQNQKSPLLRPERPRSWFFSDYTIGRGFSSGAMWCPVYSIYLFINAPAKQIFLHSSLDGCRSCCLVCMHSCVLFVKGGGLVHCIVSASMSSRCMTRVCSSKVAQHCASYPKRRTKSIPPSSHVLMLLYRNLVFNALMRTRSCHHSVLPPHQWTKVKETVERYEFGDLKLLTSSIPCHRLLFLHDSEIRVKTPLKNSQ